MEDSQQHSTVKNISKSKQFRTILNNITVEPVFILATLSRGISSLAIQHLILEKGCRVNLALNEDICNALSTRNESYPNYKTYEQDVQTLTASMFIWRDIITSVFPCLLLLFIGSWSDRYKKRKQIILNGTIADITTIVIHLISRFFFYDLPVEVDILADSLPQAITGGMPAANVGIMSYLTEVTSKEDRTSKLSQFQFLLTTAICVSMSLSGIMYQTMGFYGVFSISLIMSIIAFIYGVFFVKDIWELEARNGIVYTRRSDNFLKDFFDFDNVSKTFKVVFVKREKSGRKIIWWALFLGLLLMGTWRGETDVIYYYVKYKFGWGPVQFSMFGTFEILLIVIGNLLSLVILTKIFKIHDSFLGMIACSGKILRNLICIFGPTSMFLYFGAAINLFNDSSFITLKSLTSKLVSAEELGKMYSIFILFETFAPVIYCSLYNKIYVVTLNVFPATFFVVSTFSILPGIFIFGWLYFQWKNQQQEVVKNKPILQKGPILEVIRCGTVCARTDDTWPV